MDDFSDSRPRMVIEKTIDPKGFLLTDNDSGVDHLGESTFADAIAESVHHVDSPITIGLFAKWGSGKSFLLRHIESILKRYQRQSQIDPVERKQEDKRKCSLWCKWFVSACLVVMLITFIIFTSILAIEPNFYLQIFGIGTKSFTKIGVPGNNTTNITSIESTTSSGQSFDSYRKSATIAGMVLLVIEIFAVILLGCCGGSWASLNYYGSFRLLIYGAFTKLPVQNSFDDIVDDPSGHNKHVLTQAKPNDSKGSIENPHCKSLPRKYIFVNFKAWEYAGSDVLWAGIATNITDAIEAEFGFVTARLFRLLEIKEMPPDVLSPGTRIISIEVPLGKNCEDEKVLDMFKQYGVVEKWKKETLQDKTMECWRIQYSSAGECQIAMNCLDIKGVIYKKEESLHSAKNRHFKIGKRCFERLSRQKKKKSLRNSDSVEMTERNGGQEVSTKQDQKDDKSNCCCSRFCLHFLKYPTKFLCLPRMLWWILILLCSICIPIIAYVIANYFKLDLVKTYQSIPIVGQVFLWLPAGIAVAAFLCKFVWAMCHSQRERINVALDGTKTQMAQELGFMNKVKTEIEVVSKLVQCASFTQQLDYKIIITIDDLDRIPLQKVKSVMEAVNILLSGRSSPFICFIAIDPRIVSKCIEEEMGGILSKSNITGHEYLRKIINLPICLPPISNRCKKRFLAGLIDQADSTIDRRKETNATNASSLSRKGNETLSSADGGDCVDALSNVNENTSSMVKNVSNPHLGNTSIQPAAKIKNEKTHEELEHKKFLFQCRRYVYKNEELHKYIQGNPRNMKRLFNMISLTANIINSFYKKQQTKGLVQCLVDNQNREKREGAWNQCTTVQSSGDAKKIERTKKFAKNLVQWVILADQWPYRTSYILQIIEDAEQRQHAGLKDEEIPQHWTIFEIFQKKVKRECERGDGTLLSLDADPDLFYGYLRLLGEKHFTARTILRLQQYTVNLDYTIQHSISFRRDLSCLKTNEECKAPIPEETTTHEQGVANTAKSLEPVAKNERNAKILHSADDNSSAQRDYPPIQLHTVPKQKEVPFEYEEG